MTVDECFRASADSSICLKAEKTIYTPKEIRITAPINEVMVLRLAKIFSSEVTSV